MIKCSYHTTFIEGGQSLWTAVIISQICRNARAGNIFSEKKEALFKPWSGKDCPTEPLPESWAVFLPRSGTNCGVAHRPVSRARVVLRATVPSTVKLYTVPIVSVPGNRTNCFPAEHSYPGLLLRSESTSGLWMPAPATQNATACFRATRWSVPTRSIMKRGQPIFPLGSWNCRKL